MKRTSSAPQHPALRAPYPGTGSSLLEIPASLSAQVSQHHHSSPRHPVSTASRRVSSRGNQVHRSLARFSILSPLHSCRFQSFASNVVSPAEKKCLGVLQRSPGGMSCCGSAGRTCAADLRFRFWVGGEAGHLVGGRQKWTMLLRSSVIIPHRDLHSNVSK